MECQNPQAWIEQLKARPRIDAFDPIAARFIYSLRLLAAYERSKRDPTAELAIRLGSMTVACEALSLAREIRRAWPEPVVVSRFCCALTTFDEVSIAALVSAAGRRNRLAFFAELEGLVRPGRMARLWDAAIRYVGAEFVLSQG